MPDPAYSAKLKAAMEEVKAILKKHDIAAAVVLHTPEIVEGVEGSDGAVEFLSFLTPKYSAVEWLPLGNDIRVKGRLEYYGGDRKVRNKALRDTANMLHMLSKTMMRQGIMLADISEQVDKDLGSQYFGNDDFTPHESTQN